MTSTMYFLCVVNPRAGKDEAVMSLVKEVFGGEANITVLEELSDIYVLCSASTDILDQLRIIQSNPDVLDTQIEVLRTNLISNKKVETDNVFLILADVEAGQEDNYSEALKSELDRLGSGDAELLYIGEIFSKRADVAALLATKGGSIPLVNKKVRELPGVEDTIVYKLRNV